VDRGYGGAGGGVRFLVDWNHKYRELWLDPEKKTG
jgi:hypothetical protein